MRISALLIFLLYSFNSNAQCSVEAYLNNGDCYNTCNASASAFATGASPYTYSWSKGAATATVNTLCRDSTYIVTMIDNVGCVAMDTTTIPFDTISFSNVVVNTSCPTCCDGADTVIVGPTNPPPCNQYLYSWFPGSGFSSPIPYSTGMCVGTYTVTVSTNCGCYYSLSITVASNTTTSISENLQSEFTYSQAENSISISSSDGISEIEIMDAKGSRVLHSKEKIVNIGNLHSGIYFVAVRTSKTRIVKKILKE